MPAVIPYTVVDSVDDLAGIYAAFVLVKAINTTYYIDENGRPYIWSQAPVYYDGYDYVTNALGVRSNIVVDTANNREIYYNAKGEYRLITLTEDE